jgi:hypothetical protein
MSLRPLLLALPILLAAAAPAAAQQPDPAFVFVVATGERGLECGLLAPWESEVILTETGRIMAGLSDTQRQIVAEAAAAQADATPCDDPALTGWIAGARPGIIGEWLSPHLALFHALASMQPLPAEFAAAIGDVDLAAANAAIEAQFAAFNGEHVRPEGALDWPAFQTMIDGVAEQIVDAAEGRAGGPFTAGESVTYIDDAATIVLLWLADRD